MLLLQWYYVNYCSTATAAPGVDKTVVKSQHSPYFLSPLLSQHSQKVRQHGRKPQFGHAKKIKVKNFWCCAVVFAGIYTDDKTKA